MKEDFYISLLYKELNKSLSSEEQGQLEAWLAASPEHQETAAAVRMAWTESAQLSPVPNVDLDAAFVELEARITASEEEIAQKSTQGKLRPLGSKWIRIAAAISFLLAAVLLLSDYVTEPEIQWVEISSQEEVKRIQLADQSVLHLNKNTTLSYPKEFTGDQRLLKLDGEAFFEVEPDKSRPFIVETAKAKVEVLGTAFRLKAYSGETESLVQVEHGKVAFQAKTVGNRIILTDHDKAILYHEGNQIDKQEESDLNEISWANKIFDFQDTPLSEVLSILKNAYQVRFSGLGEQVKGCGFSSDFEQDSLEEILATITGVLGVEFVETSRNHFQVKGGSCE